MYGPIKEHLAGELAKIREAGLFKDERIIDTPQSSKVTVSTGATVLNLCANNYLGLASHPRVIAAAHRALDRWGYGMASVRFICGTQTIHKELERRLSEFLGTEDTILFSSCWDANGGVFEILLGAEDAVISDELNHASIIDGIRLSKAQRFRYKNCDMGDLEAKLVEAASARFKLVVTDGVFSMDGFYAPLAEICALAEKHGAMVMVDDSHAVGFTGAQGRGTHERSGVMGRIDILTGTLGKALGGASGGYVSGRREIVAMLRQRARPYLFSNSVAPPIAAVSLEVLDLLMDTRKTEPARAPGPPGVPGSSVPRDAPFALVGESAELRGRLEANQRFFREKMAAAGFQLLPGGHPIIPIMLGDAKVAGALAKALLDKGVYVTAFSYPVVPQGKARIRTQMSAAHSLEELGFAVEQFTAAKKELGL